MKHTLQRLGAWGVAVGALLVGVLAGPAAAIPPVQLGSDYVTDFVDAMSASDARQANERLAETYGQTGVDLYVVFVDEFTGPADSKTWTDTTADRAGLGPSQYLLGVSVEGRQFYISALDGGPLSNSELDAIEAAIKPELRDSDWLGAIEVAAGMIEGDASPGGSAGGGSGWGVLLVILAIVGVGIVVLAVMNRRKRAQQQHARDVDLESLERAAGSALIQADDAVKASADELEFARAQFGDEAVAEFAGVLGEARTRLDQAFGLRQKLDDEVPDTDEQRRAWYTQITELCTTADAMLDEKVEAFTALRQLEHNAPAALAAVRSLSERVRAGGPGAQQNLTHLQSLYAAEVLQPIADNIGQADARLSFANEQIAAAQQAIDAGETSRAAVGIRAAEQAVAQAEALQQAIAAHGAELEAAVPRSQALIAELTTDVATARSLPDPDGAVAAAIQATEAQIAQARSVLERAQRNPLRAQQSLEAANAHIDGVVEQARAQVRALQLLDAKIAQARDQVMQSENYISARRGAMGSTARTRSSEARAALAQAEHLRPHDPAGAGREADRAIQLAGAAIQAAHTDVDVFGSGQSGSGSSDMLSAVLGGIIGAGMSGGFGGGGFSGGGSRNRSSGGFGGSGRSGRSGGGGFGGGGGRSRSGGGRF